MTHVTLDNSKGKTFSNAAFQSNKSLELKVNFVETDDITVMTGPFNGFIKNREETLEKPLQWSIRLLYLNKLPLQHIFTAVNGPTISADIFSGLIGKQIKSTVSEWKIARFKTITNSSLLSADIINDLSSDQYHAYKISLAVTSWKIDSDVAKLEVGPMIHSCLQNSKILNILRKTITQFKNSCCILHKKLFSNMV